MLNVPAAIATMALPAAFIALYQGSAGASDAISDGPAGTAVREDAQAFSMPVTGLAGATREEFSAGRRLFRIVWRPESFSDATADMVGLGPLFNRHSCAGCHVRNGRGRPPVVGDTGPARGMILRLSAQNGGAAMIDPWLGAQLQDQAIPGLGREGRIALRYRERTGQFADGEPYGLRTPAYAINGAPRDHVLHVSPRVPPAIFGGGLLEAIDAAALRAVADPMDEDGDGISGRLAMIDRPGGSVIGRFGWKATRPTLRDQVVEAAAEDLGLASQERPLGACTPAQAEKIAACEQALELSEDAIEKLVIYLRGLAAPARRERGDPDVQRGEALFAAIGCTHCHLPSLPTGDYPPMPALGGQIVRPYTDLLLHDMGEDLADQAPDGAATGREWRTAPLWGIGLVPTVNGHGFLLHDGRARSLTEAILWHGGEAATARDAFVGLPADDRAALLAFIESL